MREDDITQLRKLIPPDLTLPADLTIEEMMKLQMMSIQMVMEQVRQSRAALARLHAYLDNAEANLKKLEEST